MTEYVDLRNFDNLTEVVKRIPNLRYFNQDGYPFNFKVKGMYPF